MITKEIKFKANNEDNFIARACFIKNNGNELEAEALMAVDLSGSIAIYCKVLKEGLVMYNEKGKGFIVLSDDFFEIKNARDYNDEQFSEYVNIVQDAMLDAILKNIT